MGNKCSRLSVCVTDGGHMALTGYRPVSTGVSGSEQTGSVLSRSSAHQRTRLRHRSCSLDVRKLFSREQEVVPLKSFISVFYTLGLSGL